MRQKWMTALLAACMVCMAGTAAAEETESAAEAAEIESEVESEIESEIESEMESETEANVSVQETIRVLTGLGEAVLINDTDALLTQLAVRPSFTEAWMTEDADLAAFVPEEGTIYDVRLETEDKDILVYAGVDFTDLKELRFCEKEGAVYTVRVNTEGEEEDQSAYPVVMLDETKAGYTVSLLNVRNLPSTDGEKLGVLNVAAEVTVYGETEGWYLVSYEDAYAYVSAEYVTEDQALAQQKAEEIRAAEEAARRAAEEAAWRAAQQQAQQQQQQKPADTQEPEVYEVSRENVPGCDDPDHGTTYITYSDGSVVAVPY